MGVIQVLFAATIHWFWFAFCMLLLLMEVIVRVLSGQNCKLWQQCWYRWLVKGECRFRSWWSWPLEVSHCPKSRSLTAPRLALATSLRMIDCMLRPFGPGPTVAQDIISDFASFMENFSWSCFRHCFWAIWYLSVRKHSSCAWIGDDRKDESLMTCWSQVRSGFHPIRPETGDVRELLMLVHIFWPIGKLKN